MFKLINKKDIKNYLKENNIDKISKRIIIDPKFPLNYKQSKRKGNIKQTTPFILEVLDKYYIIFNKNFIINEIEEIELKENNNQLVLYEEKNNINQNIYDNFMTVDGIKNHATIEFVNYFFI